MHGLVLDSSVAQKYGLINAGQPRSTFPLISGAKIQATHIQNKDIFEDAAFNRMYKDCDIFNISVLPHLPNIPIQGIMGTTQILERSILLLDFQNQLLRIFSDSTNIVSKFPNSQIPMVYTDKGYETPLGKFSRGLPATTVKIFWKNHHAKSINALFDTGTRNEFPIISAETDSIPGAIRTDSLRLDTDSLLIGDAIRETNKSIAIIPAYVSQLVALGTLKTCMLIGVSYLKKLKQIYFDYPGRIIYFNN